MPYKSKAQQGYFNANRAELEKQGVNVDEYNAASKGLKLPKKVKKKTKAQKDKKLVAQRADVIGTANVARQEKKGGGKDVKDKRGNK